jgi:Malic enzyme, NAD binding domain
MSELLGGLQDRTFARTMVDGVLSYQRPYIRPASEVAGWEKSPTEIDPAAAVRWPEMAALQQARADTGVIGLQTVVEKVRPTILIGASTAHGAFTRDVVEAMNVNEVISNRAIQLVGGQLGSDSRHVVARARGRGASRSADGEFHRLDQPELIEGRALSCVGACTTGDVAAQQVADRTRQ